MQFSNIRIIQDAREHKPLTPSCIITWFGTFLFTQNTKKATLFPANLMFSIRECHVCKCVNILVPSLPQCVLPYSIIDWNSTNFNDSDWLTRFIYAGMDVNLCVHLQVMRNNKDYFYLSLWLIGKNLNTKYRWIILQRFIYCLVVSHVAQECVWGVCKQGRGWAGDCWGETSVISGLGVRVRHLACVLGQAHPAERA